MQLLCAYAKLPVLTVSHHVDHEKPSERPKIGTPRQVRHRLGTRKIDCLCAEYVDGASTLDLAARYGISKQAVAKLLRGRGVPVRARQGLTTPELETAGKLYADGRSIGEVAAHLGRPASTIYHALRRAGFSTRSQMDASHLRWGID